MIRARCLVMVLTALVLPSTALASTSLNCSGPAPGKILVQVHATLDCTLEDGSFGWCDIDVKINDQWLNLPRTLRSVTSPAVFPEAPDELTGSKPLKPPITVLRVLDENKKIILELTLDKIVETDTGPVFKGRATVSWKGRHIKDAAMTCDDPG